MVQQTIHHWFFSGGLLYTILSSTMWDYYSPRTTLGQRHQQCCYSVTVVITKISPFCHCYRGNWKGLLLSTEDINTKRKHMEKIFWMHWCSLVLSWTAPFMVKTVKMSLQTWCRCLLGQNGKENRVITSMQLLPFLYFMIHKMIVFLPLRIFVHNRFQGESIGWG